MREHDGDQAAEILLTAADVARILKVKTVTVHAAAADGRLPCVRVWQGKRRSLVRFRAEDIERLIRKEAGSAEFPPSGS
jgi:excisionase family DNA binding protein